jgi:hypothetical protein
LSWLHTRDEDVPIMIGSIPLGIEWDDPGRLRVILSIEQEQVHLRGLLGKDAEVDAIG